jgi:hypothetical protein
MQQFVPLAFAGLFLLFAAFPGQAEETNYVVQKRDANPDFWSSIRRHGPCAVAGEPQPSWIMAIKWSITGLKR